MKKYFALTQEGNVLEIDIYGDITSYEWYESDTSAYTLKRKIESMDVDTINVYINSYGGEVAEGLAIYNALKRHKAKVHTFVDGFACSAASVIFMAGDVRTMPTTSLLMIHNAWTYACGNSDELRKQADDLDTINQATMNAYLESVNIPEEELKTLLDAETWINAQDALEKGFATAIVSDDAGAGINQSARKAVYNKLNEKKATVEKPKEEKTDPSEVLGSFLMAISADKGGK